jgi:hypothetical protein
MQNLAGDINASVYIHQELTNANIRAAQVFVKRMPEVPSTLIGVMTFANGVSVVFDRRWYYWAVRISTRLPFLSARSLNEQYGSTVRVNGYSGGTDVPPEGCDSYHVDTMDGLVVLARRLRATFGTEVVESRKWVALGLLDAALYYD